MVRLEIKLGALISKDSRKKYLCIKFTNHELGHAITRISRVEFPEAKSRHYYFIIQEISNLKHQ